MKSLVPYADKYGLLCRQQFTSRGVVLDGGDSLHKTSHWAIYSYLGGTYESIEDLRRSTKALINCIMGYSMVVRNPDPDKWYSKPNTLSRDQLKAYLAFLSISGAKRTLKHLFLNHMTRLLLFTTNTRNNGSYPTLEEYNKHSPQKPWDGYKWKIPDVTLFEVWALYIRGFRAQFLYPLLLIFDLESLVGAILSKYNGNTDLANDLGAYLLSKQTMDTPVMWLARKIAKPYLYARLETYFTQEGEPPLHEYAKPLIEAL